MSYSNEYLKELEILHDKKSFGAAGNPPAKVHELLNLDNVNSILDFGAGKGNTSKRIKQDYPDITLYTYDPVTFPIYLPKTVDMIYSSDVLEHIEPSLIDETLADLFSRAQEYQYHLIACHPAKKTLSDGRNAHLIIEDPDWWKQKIQNIEGWKIIFEEIIERIATPKKGKQIQVVKYVVIMEKI
jgi:hypothetical protein